jgi:hypothetical protein
MREFFPMPKTALPLLLRRIGYPFALGLCMLLTCRCEKDDICVDGDTPLLVVRFFDSENPGNPKSVISLRVLGLGQENAVNTFADRSTQDSIAIPLRPGETETTFVMIQDSADEEGLETGNPDTVRFNYTTGEVFISRACGFVAQYEGLQSQLQAGSGNWIRNIEVDNPLVINQDSTHVSIFH